MPNLGQLRAQVRAIADVDATDVSDADINTYLNDAYQEAIADEQWPFLYARVAFDTVAAQSDYTSTTVQPSGDLEVHRILDVASQGVKLRRIEPSQYFSLQPFGGSVSGGSFQAWTTLDADKLVLWPTPGSIASVQVVYLKLATDLTQDADTPQIPSRYHHVLKWGGLKYVYTKIGDLESAEGAQKQFEELSRSMVAELIRSTPQTQLIWGEYADQRVPAFGRLRYPWE